MTRSNDGKQLLLFFIITLAWTWGFGFAPVFMGIEGTPLGTFLFYFGGGALEKRALGDFSPRPSRAKNVKSNDTVNFTCFSAPQALAQRTTSGADLEGVTVDLSVVRQKIFFFGCSRNP